MGPADVVRSNPVRIDFVSDVVCPWCAIGLSALEEAMRRIGPALAVRMHFQPFQLNPQMPPQGEDIGEHLARKYGSSPQQQASNYEAIRQRGAALGFTFRAEGRGRTWNTFDCHRLLHWAGVLDEAAGERAAAKPNADPAGAPSSIQWRWKKRMLGHYFTEGLNPGDPALLVADAQALGLDAEEARAILGSNRYHDEVRARQAFYAQHGIQAVPAVILNEQYLISGGQPVEVFEEALRSVAAQST